MAEPQTYDYSTPRLRGWGHTIYIDKVTDDGREIKATMFVSARVRVGDFVLLEHTSKKSRASTRYRITAVETAMDPSDLHFVTLEFAPRPDSIYG